MPTISQRCEYPFEQQHLNKLRETAEKGVEDKQDNLLHACVSARLRGADFPTIWRDMLMNHPLVESLPIQQLIANEPVLEIHLITGKRLVFGSKGFSIR
jgi:hypothetical protein